jgi:hypothetical protein
MDPALLCGRQAPLHTAAGLARSARALR